MSSSPSALTCLLLVEGSSDEKFFDAYLTKLQLRRRFEIKRLDGRSNLRSTLSLLIDNANRNMASVYSTIGIVLDVDEQRPTEAFQSVRDTLAGLFTQKGLFALFPLPEQALSLSSSQPPIGVYLMPFGGLDANQGSLETLLRSSLENDDYSACVHELFVCARQQNPHPKSWISAYQAIRSQRSSDRSRDADYVFQSSWWNWEHSALNPLRDFLNRLAEKLDTTP